LAELFITGLGTYLPEQLVSNRDLPPLQPPHSLADMDKVGVRTRGIANDREDVLFMALRAAERALEQARLSADALDFLILANWSERRYVPDLAPRVQHALGARRAFAFDVGCACMGFLYGLTLAHGYLQNPRFRCGLVLSSDRSTRRIRPASRATLVFGDAAAAMVVERDWFLPHSGTAGVQAMLAEHLGAPPEKTLNNLADVGNVTSASIPVSLQHFMDQGRLKPGDRVLSAAVGLGWQYGAVLYTL
jgi:3-oxoacyl-[acyl-carrier-protein] synthase III